ncbi:amidohydrolase family protein [Ancylobacter terrae]|uniref:amidohydrolase family protein n=1 Tax=Ancylobacter sp. sgz301288 TaxID=3342077 RepID=UPI00385C4234
MLRRTFLKGAASLAALGGIGARSVAYGQSAPALPARSNLVIRNAYVMTMDPALGDIARGDVHVKDGVIVAVGPALPADGAEVIDGAGTIVMPGLVDTHWHMWNALLRSMSGDVKERGYFPLRIGFGKKYVPGDMYAGTRIATAEALHSGITTVNDWCHNIVGPEFAREDLRALTEAGIRARFSYGNNAAAGPTSPVDWDDIRKLKGEWDKWSNGGLIKLGFAWRGLGNNPEVAKLGKSDIETARSLGLPITVHASSTKAQIGQVQAMADAGLLGPDLQIVHATQATDSEIAAMKAANTAVSLSPYTELRIGYGLTPIMRFLKAGVRTGLSVDTTALSGSANMFEIMKVLQNLANAMAENEFELPAKRILELATIEGARSIGMDGEIGSLTPGKRADVIAIALDAPNLGPLTNAAHMVVEAAQPANVDLVLVDGRVLKKGGKLTTLDTAAVNAGAATALARLRQQIDW